LSRYENLDRMQAILRANLKLSIANLKSSRTPSPVLQGYRLQGSLAIEGDQREGLTSPLFHNLIKTAAVAALVMNENFLVLV